jgi:hypothetical protein
MSKKELTKKFYCSKYAPNSSDYYIVFDLNAVNVEEEYKNVRWDISRMITDGIINKGHSSAAPEGISLAKIMKYIIHDYT